MRYSAILLVLASALLLISFGCTLGQQPQEPEVKEVLRTVYICPDGSEASAKSDCVLPEIPQCEEKPQEPGAKEPTKPKEITCGGEAKISCSRGYYCKLENGATEGTCAKMVPVGLSLSPPGAYYDYTIGGGWTGSFDVMNAGNTPIELYFTSDSKYVTILTNATYVEPGKRATVRYRVYFSDNKLPVGTNTLAISVNAPVDNFVVQSFKITVFRAF